jgi:hypothetical protein
LRQIINTKFSRYTLGIYAHAWTVFDIDLAFYKDLVYAFIAVTAILVATTAYLATRKPKTKPETEKEAETPPKAGTKTEPETRPETKTETGPETKQEA